VDVTLSVVSPVSVAEPSSGSTAHDALPAINAAIDMYRKS
jgi:hypothetical protein